MYQLWAILVSVIVCLGMLSVERGDCVRLVDVPRPRWTDFDAYRLGYYLGSARPFRPDPAHPLYVRMHRLFRTWNTSLWVYHYVVLKLYLRHPQHVHLPVYFEPGDVFTGKDAPCLCKTRPALGGGQNVLLPFNYQRHWKGVWDIFEKDIPFDQKASKAVWRGVSTGDWTKPLGRRALIERHSASEDARIDVGITEYLQGVAEVRPPKKPLSIEEQLKHKYLVSVEGNDVATGLKWMLNSNSVVLMPAPKICSWFMEDHLTPFEHYVPLRADFADLSEKIDWCEAHPEACKKISANAKSYVSRFGDRAREARLADRVFDAYMRMVI
jgi:hypothetical protein